MTKTIDDPILKKVSNKNKEDTKIYFDELYFRHVDQKERWRQEYKKSQKIESKLAEVSNLSYQEFDYNSLLVRVPWKERVVPDFSYMIEDARIAAESKFFTPIIIHLILILFLFFLLIASSNVVLLWIAGTGIVVVLSLLILMVQKRQSHIQGVIIETTQEINDRIAYEERLIATEKKKHEDAEEGRIKGVECLLAGESSAIFSRIDNVLSKSTFPFPFYVDIELYANIPSIKVWLPPKSIIPTQICSLQPSGRPSVEDKDARTINKQYLELCGAMVIKVMSVIYSHIPIFSTGYVYGMTKEGINNECLIRIKLDRKILVDACNVANGLAAMQISNANFECDTSLALLPIETDQPEEWGEIEKQLIRSLRVDVFKQ